MLPTYAISVSSTSVLLARYAWVAATHGLHVTRVKLMVAGVKEVFEEEVRAVSEIPKLPLFFFFIWRFSTYLSKIESLVRRTSKSARHANFIVVDSVW